MHLPRVGEGPLCFGWGAAAGGWRGCQPCRFAGSHQYHIRKQLLRGLEGAHILLHHGEVNIVG